MGISSVNGNSMAFKGRANVGEEAVKTSGKKKAAIAAAAVGTLAVAGLGVAAYKGKLNKATFAKMGQKIKGYFKEPKTIAADLKAIPGKVKNAAGSALESVKTKFTAFKTFISEKMPRFAKKAEQAVEEAAE